MSWWLLIPYALVMGLVLVTNPGQGLAQGKPSHAKLSRAIDINPDPDVFETIIVATEETVDLGDGLLANVYTYNGTVPGPEFHFKVGDRVIVHFTNFLPEPSSIHWHGIELNNASDGTPVTQNPVKFGETYTYRFVVPHPGVYWYHPHFKPTNPEFKGQYGSFIVEDPAEPALRAAGVIPNRGHTRTLVLSDTTVCKAPGENDTETFPTDDPDLPWSGGDEFPGQTLSPNPDKLCENPRDNVGNPLGTGPLAAGDIPNVQAADDCRFQKDCATNEGQLVLVNGKVPGAREGSPQDPGELMSGASVLNVKAGSGLRLQLIAATVTRYFRLLMTDQYGDPVPLYRIGGEGGLLDRVRVEGGTQQLLDTKYDSGEILLAPSDRADVVLVVPDGRPGDIVTLWTLDYERTGQPAGGGFAKIPTVPVLHLRIVGSANKSQRYAISDREELRVHRSVLDPTEDLCGLPITDHLLDPDPTEDLCSLPITDHLLDPALLPDPKPGDPVEIRHGEPVAFGQVGFWFLREAGGLSERGPKAIALATVKPSKAVVFGDQEDTKVGLVEFPMRLVEPTGGGGGLVETADKRVQLTTTQFEFMQLLIKRMTEEPHQPDAVRGFVRSSELIARLSWDTAHPTDNHVKQLVRRIRRALIKAEVGNLIHSQHRFGYRLRVIPIADL